MPDQYGVVTRLLEKMGQSDWNVVEPMPGGMSQNVWIQNARKRLDGYVQLSPQDADIFPEDVIIALIETAIANATDERYRS
jgi:hypothetical protein